MVFPLFRLNQMWFHMWASALEKGPGRANDDQENIDNCCHECSCLCFPCIVVADIITCPCQLGMWFMAKAKTTSTTSGSTSISV